MFSETQHSLGNIYIANLFLQLVTKSKLNQNTISLTCSKKVLYSEIERTKDIFVKNLYSLDLIKRVTKPHDNNLNQSKKNIPEKFWVVLIL